MWPLLSSLLLFNLISYAQGSCPLKDGDLVFIKSQTAQAGLLRIATDSEWSHVGMAFKAQKGWDIIEAVQPVQWTSLYSFVRRSNNLQFEIFRATFDFDAAAVKAYAEKFLGSDYDLIFAWDQNRWYCSELVWKAYEKVTSEHLGVLQKIGDLKVTDPRVLAEAKRRYEVYGMIWDQDAWFQSEVITPVQKMKSDKLQKVFDTRDRASMQDCIIN